MASSFRRGLIEAADRLRRFAADIIIGQGLEGFAAVAGTEVIDLAFIKTGPGIGGGNGLTADGIDVRWLTDEPDHGVARALVGGRIVDERRTDRGKVHAARLEVAGSTVVIEYGVDEPGRLHRTTIHLETPRAAEIEPTPSDSVYIFGDVHGKFDRIEI